jgi:hypothetical protein
MSSSIPSTGAIILCAGWSGSMNGSPKLRLEATKRGVMRQRIVFAFFAALILLSMLRDWSAPAACARALFLTAVSNR